MWKDFEQCQKNGLTKSIGVCNLNCMLIMDMLNYCEIKPVVNQIELHSYLPQTHLITTIVIPKSMNPERLKLNFEAMYIHLESEEIQKLENLPYQLRCYDPKRWEWLARLPLYD